MPIIRRPLFLYLCIALVTSSVAQQHRKHSFRRHLPPPAHLRVVDLSTADDAELLDGEESQGAGGGGKKQTHQKNKQTNGDDEDKPKTLSQQVADGKYGLIQNELFRKPPKRPGVISYNDNPEVPNDTASNFGGLNENEIWLAENHLLVLRGGQYPPHNAKKPPDEENGLLMWPPIDDYKAPLHQVKIPKNPKVPPPFPVPFQIFAGTQNAQNQTDSTGATQEASKATNPDPSHATAGQAAVPIFEPGGPGEEWRGLPLPPSQTQLNGTWRPPFLEYLPPGAVILPPPDNRTEQIDEEDPSIYYPPPYTFYYRQDNTSKVPPGPLVPGIVLPPPPDFFAPLEEEIVNNTITTPTKLTTNKPHRTRKPITTQHLNTQINPTTTPLPPTTQKSVKIYPVVKTSTTTTTSAPTVVTILPVRQDRIYLPNKKRPQDVTVLRPVQPQTTKSPHRGVYVYENEIPNKPYVQYATPTKKKTYSTTQEPVEYYTTPKTLQVTPRGPQEIPNNHYLQYASPDNPQTTVTTTKVPAKYYDTSIHQEGPYVQYTSKKTTTPPPARYHTITTSEEVTSNPYVQFATSGGKKNIIVSTTQVPLKYYTTSNNLEVNPGKVKTTSKPKVVPSDYFYYEETEKNRQTTTQKPRYYQPSTEGYYIKPSPRPRRPQYIYVSAKPYNTQKPRFRPVKSRDSFSVHVAKIQKHINQYLPTSRPSPKPVYQYSFEANGYKSTKGNFRPSPSELNEDHFRPVPKYSVEIQQAIEVIPSTEAPRYQTTVAPPSKYHEYHVVPATEAPPVKYEQYQVVPSSELPPMNYQGYQIVSNSELPPHIPQYQIVPSTESQVYQIVPVTKSPPVNYPEVEIVKSTEIPFYEQSTERPGYYGRYEKAPQKDKYLNKAVPTPRPISQYSFEATANPLYHGFYTKPEQEYLDDNTKHYFTMFGKKLPGSTTPIPPREGNRGQSYNQQKANTPHSLQDDTAVNYLNPRPTLEPEAEVIRHYPKVSRYPPRDQKVNERPEIVKAIPIQVPSDDVDGTFVSYQLPGDNGAHFYFLTPQLAERTQQGTGFYFTRADNQRRRRNDTSNEKNG